MVFIPIFDNLVNNLMEIGSIFFSLSSDYSNSYSLRFMFAPIYVNFDFKLVNILLIQHFFCMPAFISLGHDLGLFKVRTLDVLNN